MQKRLYLIMSVAVVASAALFFIASSTRHTIIPTGSSHVTRPSDTTSVQKISHIDLKAKLNDPNVTIINLSPNTDYNDCHITGSINIQFADLEATVSSWDKNKEIIVYGKCNQCTISSDAYNLLKSLEFKNVSLYREGIKGWKKAQEIYNPEEYPTTGPCELP